MLTIRHPIHRGLLFRVLIALAAALLVILFAGDGPSRELVSLTGALAA